MQYYGRFYRSKPSPVLARINAYLVRWIRNRYRRLDRTRAPHAKLAELAASQLRLSGTGPGSPLPGDEDDKSPVTGDRHAGICGSRGLQCPRPPDPADQGVAVRFQVLRDDRQDHDRFALLGRLRGECTDSLSAGTIK